MRTFFGLVFFLPFLLHNHAQFFKTKKTSLHLLRICTSISAMLCTYYTYRHLPLGLATSLGMTGALFTTLLSILFLKERVDKTKWVLIVIGYLGALCIIKPHRFVLEIGIITGLLANILAGSSIILAKILSRYDSTVTIMGYTNIGLFLVAAVLNFHGWQAIGLKDLGLLAVIALLGLCAQYCSITALKQTRPSFLAPFEYTRLLFSFLIGFLFFRELPDPYTIIGSIIIIGATYTITYREKSSNI
jgi:drug/metabolite transporter (DMT)-like permease